MSPKPSLVLLLALSAGAAALPAATLAQAVSTNGGSIQGTITDPTGAAVPGASVTIKGTDTGSTKTVSTDSAGFYAVGPLNPGSYTVTITDAGFQTTTVSTIVRVGTATPGSFKLTVGNTAQTVEVTAGELQINTDQIGVSGVVTSQQIETLPINGRNILDVAQLQPGVILQSGESFDPTKAGYSAISVSGVSGRTTRILLDGQDITDETVGTTIFNVPTGPIDEFQLNRATQDVSGEVTSTGQVLLTTKTGTNAIHGNAFYNFQDAAVGFAADANGLNAPFQRNQFGGYVGGPLIKDKLFFFGGAERIKQFADNPAVVPTLFTDISNQYPYVPAPFKDTYSTARLDYNGPKGLHLFARGTYSVNADDSAFGFIYSVYQNRDNVPAIVGGADFAGGRFTHSFRVGYEKFHNLLGDATAQLGSSIYNPSTAATGPLTLYDPFDGAGFYAGVNYLAPQQTYQSDKQVRYDGTWTHGAHQLKFGYSLNHILGGGFAEFFGASLFTEFASFTQLSNCGGVAGAAACPGDPLNGYTPYGFLVGNGFGFFSPTPGFGEAGGGVHDWREGAYIADTWKISPTFTVVGGLRYSVDTDRANQQYPSPLCSSVVSNLQFPGCTGNTYLFDQFQQGLGGNTHQPYGDFGPQAGFVFSPGNQKTSFRGGIGIFYENTVFNDEGNAGPAVIQAQGQYQNDGDVCFGSPNAYLPGLGSVSSINGVALSTICGESIAQAAPQLNALKAQYQAAVKGSAQANPSFIGNSLSSTGGIYGKPFVEPYSIQYNGGIQRELVKGVILSADYVHNSTIKTPLSIDVNHVGAARYLNTTAAQNAINATVVACGAASITQAVGPGGCPGLHPATATTAAGSATIQDFAGNGLDSGNVYLDSAPAAAITNAAGVPLNPNTGAAFAGANPNVGEGRFILPVGRSGYDAAQIVLQEQRAHPFRGIVESNFQISYTLSRVVSSGSNAASGDQFFNPNAVDNDNPNEFIGRNSLDHTNEVSFGGSIGVKYGLQIGVIGHFFSAPPTTLTLNGVNGSGSGAGQIFISDVTGDGTVGDVLPNTEIGDYMHRVKPSNLNAVLTQYNETYAGQPTPAGKALIAAGLFTTQQLIAAGGVQQAIPLSPTTPLANPAFREFDFNASYPIRFTRFREGLSIVPGVAIYNVANMANYGTLSGSLNGVFNGDTDPGATLNSLRVQRGSGTFDQGGPRSTEFQLKVNF